MIRFTLLIVAAVLLAGCGGTTTKTVTTTITETVEIEVPPDPAVAAAPPSATTEDTEPALATRRRRAGEVLFTGEGLQAAGPKMFRGGVYTARFEQWAPEDPSLNFRSDASSIVVQLNRKPGVIDASTVTVTNATKQKGKTSVTVPAGRWYTDVSADHSWVVRFTPAS